MNNKTLYKVIITVCIVVGIVAGAMFAKQLSDRRNAEKTLSELSESTTAKAEGAPKAAQVNVPATPEVTEEPTGAEKTKLLMEKLGIEDPGKEIDFDSLREEKNEDIYSWLYIPGSVIDYPVLQHPTDNAYYLHHNIDNSAGYPGCIYSELYNSKDYSDRVTVLYGHNMRNGTMFADLHLFEDEEYFENTPYFFIYTPEGLNIYEIFAAFEHTDEHLMMKHDFKVDYEFEQFFKMIKDTRQMNSHVRDGVEINTEDKIVILSTCVTGRDNHRYLVVGRLVE